MLLVREKHTQIAMQAIKDVSYICALIGKITTNLTVFAAIFISGANHARRNFPLVRRITNALRHDRNMNTAQQIRRLGAIPCSAPATDQTNRPIFHVRITKPGQFDGPHSVAELQLAVQLEQPIVVVTVAKRVFLVRESLLHRHQLAFGVFVGGADANLGYASGTVSGRQDPLTADYGAATILICAAVRL